MNPPFPFPLPPIDLTWLTDLFVKAIAALLTALASGLSDLLGQMFTVDSPFNFISRTPPDLSYDSQTVQDLGGPRAPWPTRRSARWWSGVDSTPWSARTSAPPTTTSWSWRPGSCSAPLRPRAPAARWSPSPETGGHFGPKQPVTLAEIHNIWGGRFIYPSTLLAPEGDLPRHRGKPELGRGVPERCARHRHRRRTHECGGARHPQQIVKHDGTPRVLWRRARAAPSRSRSVVRRLSSARWLLSHDGGRVRARATRHDGPLNPQHAP
jgi:hypothetical protein